MRGLLAALDGRFVAAGPGRRAGARAARRAADRAQSLPRSIRAPCRRAPPGRSAGAPPRRSSAATLQDHGDWPRAHRARSLGQRHDAHRRRRSRAGLRLIWRAAALGLRLQPRHRLRDPAAGDARPSARRRDLAHLRPVPRRLPGADRAVRSRRAGGRRAATRTTPTIRWPPRAGAASGSRASSAPRPAAMASASRALALSGDWAEPRRTRRSLSRAPRHSLWRRAEGRRTPQAFRDRVAQRRRARSCAGHGGPGRARRRRLRRTRGRLRRRGCVARRDAGALSSRHQPARSAEGADACARRSRACCAAAPTIRAGSRARCATAIAAPPRSPKASIPLRLRRDHRRRARRIVRSLLRRCSATSRVTRFCAAQSGGRRRDRRALRGSASPRALGAAPQRRRRRTGCDRDARCAGEAHERAARVKGWCPGALRPMLTGDGLIVRAAPAWRQSAGRGAARRSPMRRARFGNGQIDLLARQSAVARRRRCEAARRCWAAAGGARAARRQRRKPRPIRNIVVSPLAGLDPTSSSIVAPIARALETRLATNRRVAGAAGQVRLRGRRRRPLPLGDLEADVRFAARRDGAETASRSALAGGARREWLGRIRPADCRAVAARLARAVACAQHDASRAACAFALTRVARIRPSSPCPAAARRRCIERSMRSRSAAALIALVEHAVPSALGAAVRAYRERTLARSRPSCASSASREVRLSPWRTLYARRAEPLACANSSSRTRARSA